MPICAYVYDIFFIHPSMNGHLVCFHVLANVNIAAVNMGVHMSFQTMEYYLAMKTNEIMHFAATWMDLETIILNEIRERQTSYGITYMWNLKKVYKWTYLQNRNRFTEFENKLMVTKGDRWGGGWTGGLGLAYAHCGIWNDWLMGTCCIVQGTLPNVLWWSMWGKNLKKNGCMYVYNWITLFYIRNYHNIVNQLYFNKNLKK